MVPTKLCLRPRVLRLLTRPKLQWRCLLLSSSGSLMADWSKLPRRSTGSNPNLPQEDPSLLHKWMPVVTHHRREEESIDPCLQLATRSLEKRNSSRSTPRSNWSSAQSESMPPRKMRIGMSLFRTHSRFYSHPSSSFSENMWPPLERIWDKS